jgi:succinate dehydrogenase/fumarate reductase flavoprotein subunit
LHAQASLLRTESRKIPDFYRADYPDQDDKHWQNVAITVQNIGGKAKYVLKKV